MSSQAANQLAELHLLMQEREMNIELHDIWAIWHYIWAPTLFNTRKGYSQLLGTVEASPLFTWLWSSSNLVKHKFLWLLLRDRLNTRNLLRRKNKDLDDYSCVLCNSLFFECSFSQDCWNTLHIHETLTCNL